MEVDTPQTNIKEQAINSGLKQGHTNTEAQLTVEVRSSKTKTMISYYKWRKKTHLAELLDAAGGRRN